MAWIAPAISVASSLYGQQQAKKQSEAAEKARQQAMAQFMGIELPNIEDQQLNPQMLEYLGDLAPQMESNIGMGPSAMEGISTDPRLAQAQMAALEQLTGISQSGILPGEEAALRQARRGAAAETQAKSAQLMDEFARRGMGGSGAELAARLQASQAGGERLGEESDRLMQMAQQRALEAIGQSAGLAGNIRQQSFGEQADVSKAKDVINQFNTQNRQAVQQRNVSSANQAALRNLSEQQRLAEGNVAQKNMAQQYNKELLQQQYENKLKKAAGVTGQLGGIAGAKEAQAGRTADMWSGIGQGAGTAAAGYFQNKSDDGFSKQEEDDFLNKGKY